jgi:class 3 adenylate cyclase
METQHNSRRLESRPSETAPEEVEVALLFCDVVRSTELTRRLGDRGAYGVIRCFHKLVLRAAAAFQGQELEVRGDGVLLAFESPPLAADCAVEIQRELLELPEGRRVSVRIGVHTGPVLRIADGYFGSNVILSARVAEEAAPGEILASAALVRCMADRNVDIGAGRWVSLKGIPEPNLVFSLPWRPRWAALAEPPCPSAAHEALLLTLGCVRESLPNQDEASCMLAGRNAV